jgi:hypothetical protein
MVKVLSTKLVNENKTYRDKHMSRRYYSHTKHHTKLQHDIHHTNWCMVCNHWRQLNMFCDHSMEDHGTQFQYGYLLIGCMSWKNYMGTIQRHRIMLPMLNGINPYGHSISWRHCKKSQLFKKITWLKCSHWPKGISILIKGLGHEKTSYILLKWHFWPSVKLKILSRWTNIHQNGHGLIKLAILNGYCLVKLTILIRPLGKLTIMIWNLVKWIIFIWWFNLLVKPMHTYLT